MQLNMCNIIGCSPALVKVFKLLAKVAPTDSTVLVTGESGTGKELLVRAIHANSTRHDKPFVPIHCGAIPKELIESELFGHEKGAFTHAIRTRPGRFELADGGTIFLDEIGELDLSLQVKILRALQEKEFERVGSNTTRKTNVRIVAATNRHLDREVQAGRFREDLFYRLNVIPLHLPPLRERGEDVFLLADTFLARFARRRGGKSLDLSTTTRNLLLTYSWPGNIRELENFMERMSIICEGPQITPEDLPPKILAEANAAKTITQSMVHSAKADFIWPTLSDITNNGMGLKEFLDEVEDRLLVEAMKITNGVKNQAAELLRVKRTTLIEKLKKKQLKQ